MIVRLDHVGFASPSADEGTALMKRLGLVLAASGAADDYGVSCDFWQAGDDPQGTTVEVVAPTRPDAAITRRVAMSGSSLYHLAFEVDSLAEELSRLRRAGFLPIDRTPRCGAKDDMRVAFVLDPTTDLLIELVHYGG
ncbi:methylmalonyl-CoA epimerase [Catellatospora methionotrophica]|uniref:Methylmalonyl-CoA epimerase n=1 Tax=Catellatospora methionotrophica TaxID=121620 RepID=A0A8J3LAD4_9ACTN|nr:VOC family protein [Catellatospora methionotrophica]GIG14563.1 methylmalonyl-CoA epimerase [Catellatospora methionotrophica]